ncbi:Abi-domain-containing protein [Coemansia reversa NRRL 1564]|uniref:intramembrane prenyl-peptidase Rce1 n=1 Tax=Coemansia reversa (strain ATCC 12441 / NRRL 1564) TaxID=763665 RepID=A0A2G5B6W6_COERN|nr:Abi-domain-containing protein [Coemansia reversa NRRL 1564]|eukprot:PIA14749.1 Abi-domain-containing protein [Coemansia reversa NRRL 1564]
MYVASIYVFMALFPVDGASIHDRDNPHIMRRRMFGVSVSTLVSLLISAFVLRRWQPEDAKDMGLAATLALLGLEGHMVLPSVLVSLVLMAVLFLGPLILDNLNGVFSWENLRRLPKNLWNQPEYIRNYVVGPVTEELVFRSSVIPLWATAGLSTNICVFVSPVIFGVAHVHRAISQYAMGNQALLKILVSTTVQLTYTTVFGWIVAALFLRTRSIAGPIVAHVFCNIQGLPDIGGIAHHTRYKYFIWLSFIVGLVGFLVLFEPMTRPGVFVPV